MAGSFISDTLTLNGANCNNINDIVNKYRTSLNRSFNSNMNTNNNNNRNDEREEEEFNDDNLIVVGKGINKSLVNETFEDEKVSKSVFAKLFFTKKLIK